jgi:hypothetical protein
MHFVARGHCGECSIREVGAEEEELGEGAIERRRPDCVAGHVRFEVRREAGKE